MLIKEDVFRSVFNCATLPMVLVQAEDADFKIIAQNEQHLSLSGNNLEGLFLQTAFEQACLQDAQDPQLLSNSLKLVFSNQQAIQIPALNFKGYISATDGGDIFRLEIVPVPETEAALALLTWHPIDSQGIIPQPEQLMPTMETPLGEQLAETSEQIEIGNEELEAANEELVAVSDELLQTKAELDLLSRKLERISNPENENGNHLEIENQRDRLRRFLMQAPAGICVLDGAGFILELVNPAFRQLFPDRKLLGKSVLEAFPEIKEQQIWPILNNVFRTGKTFQGNEWLIPLSNAEGELEDRYFNFIYQARFDASGKTDGVLIFVYEVTDMVQIRLEVEENERRFRLLLNAIPQIAWTNATDGAVNFYNEQWYTYTGIDFEQSQPQDLEAVVHPEDLAHHKTQFQSILISEESGNYEIRERAANGEYRWYLIHMQPIKDEAEQVLLWIGTATDIHELKLLQQKKDDLINIASHELKTPMASLKASMQLLHKMKHNSSEKMQHLIDMAGRSTDKVSGLIKDLLDPEQLTEGGLPLKKVELNLFRLVEDCCIPAPENSNCSIVITGDQQLEVYADPERIEQVLINMVNNAMKYAPQSESIQIQVAQINEGAKVSVRDQGPGIPGDKIPFLFDRYYRADQSNQPGLGLGLYISAEIIEKHAGQIGAESKAGVGSTFWFTLPLAK